VKSIKTTLIMLIVGVLFGVSVTFGLVSYIQSKAILLKQTEQDFTRLTGEISRVVKANMDVNIAVMESLAEQRIVDDGTSWSEKISFLNSEAKRTGFDMYAITDISGNATFFNMQRTTYNISDRTYFKRALSGVSTYSDVVINKDTGLLTVTVAVPLKRNGRITGVLFGMRNGDEITKLVEAIQIGETGYAYIINRDGTIQGHKNKKLVNEMYNPIKKAESDKSITPLAGFLKKTMAEGGGTDQYNFGGRDIYGSLAPIQSTDGWSVVLAMELDEIFSGINYLRNIILIITIVLLVIGGITAYYIGNSITAPVIASVKFAGNLAELDLTKVVHSEYLDRKDELGTLATAFQRLSSLLKETVVGIINAAQQVAIATEQIGQDNQNLSQRTSEQASSLEEIAATIEEANASTKQNSDNAVEASKLANNTLSLAENGGIIVDKAVESIREINASSAKIADIITMINEIAFQTNLLALNAAVEAARAGDQGRGFAVVAGEVRNLAQRAGAAAKEIDLLIKDSVDKIETGTNLVNKSGESLKGIIEAVKQVNMIVSEMASSNDEQRRGIEQITIAVTDLDSMTQQNAALVEETAAASEEMSGQAKELLSMIQRFNVGDAADQVTDFKIHSERKVKEHAGLTGTKNKKPVSNKEKSELPGNSKTNNYFDDENYEKF